MRARDLVTAVLGLAVVATVVWFGWTLLADPGGPEDPQDAAASLAQAYLSAWEDGDVATMGGLVRDAPDDFAEPHLQLAEGLEPTSLRLRAGEPDHEADGRARVPFEVELDLTAPLGTVGWDSELVLVRERGRWGVQWTPATIHPELQPGDRFAVERADVDRRPILAADGTQLAGPGEQVTFGFQPALVDDEEAVIRAFEAAIPGSGTAAERELSRGDLNPDWFYPVVTVGSARAEVAAPRLREARGILRRTSDEARVLLDEGFARHLVGVVDEATAEQLERLAEAGVETERGFEMGQFGLEAALEDQLVGSELVRVGLREGDTGPLRVVLAEGQDDPSEEVTTTLDVAVQRAVENTLFGLDETGAIVVVDGRDGAVVASASRPLSGFDRGLSGRYPPGSTFKIVTAEAALEAGWQPDDELDCPARTVVGGLAVTNSGNRDLGTVTLAEAFAESCNTTFARLAAELGSERLTAAAERFGFGVEPRLPVEAFLGSFPPPADTAELAAASFGQARVEASPLHLASVAAAVAGGAWHEPRILADAEATERRTLATGTADRLRDLLRLAVSSGTGAPADVEGQQVGGKTGTAQGTGGTEHAWFVGTFEGLGFAVLVEGGGAGSEVAAPLAGRFVRELVALRHGAADPEEAPEPDQLAP